MSRSLPPWRLWIDTGGTFTDCLAVDPTGALRRAKVLSSGALRGRVESVEAKELTFASPLGLDQLPDGFFRTCAACPLGEEEASIEVVESLTGRLILDRPWPHGEIAVELRSPDKAPVLAARFVTRTPHGSSLPPAEVRFATTRGTNALLERRGISPVLVVTRGFRDLLAIGNQQRPDLCALRVEKPEPLYGSVIEADERLRPDGSIEISLDQEALFEQARAQQERGFDSAAVAFLHSYRNSEHEVQAAAVLREAGFEQVSRSSALSSRIKIVPRAQTAVVDAYLATVVGDYLARLDDDLGARSLHVMGSAGGLSRAAEYHAKDSLLSGPAAGVVGAVAAASLSGEERLLAFDMGGTSTDVTRHDGRLEYRSETVVGDARLSSPSLAVETVAAGGGSICRFDGRQLKVGPESAGADPGPACYGKNGPLALTDVNLLLGRLPTGHFPFPVDRRAAERRADEVCSQHRLNSGSAASMEELLLGFLKIANETMAGAVRGISLRAGYRPSDYTLVTFGGAGPQHACGLASELGICRVLVPDDASLLSAFGLGQARIERFVERQVIAPLSDAERSLPVWFDELRNEALDLLIAEGVRDEESSVERREVFLRFVGQEATLAVDWTSVSDLVAAFSASYEAHFGYCPSGREIEVESLRLVASGPAEERDRQRKSEGLGASDELVVTGKLYATQGWLSGPIVSRRALTSHGGIEGPAWITEENTVTVVESGWSARLDQAGALILEYS